MSTPKKPGYYWMKGTDEDGQPVEQVVEVGTLGVNKEDLFYWVPGAVGAVYIDAETMKDVEWSDRIPTMAELDRLLENMKYISAFLIEAGVPVSFQDKINEYIKDRTT